ncbi:MAG: GNAT family N-acetyltransferase [Chlamydiota bacterium]
MLSKNIIAKALQHSWKSFGMLQGFDYDELQGIFLFKSFIENPFFNYAYASQEADTMSISKVLDYFDGLPFSLICDGDDEKSLSEVLKAQGLHYDDSCEGMILELQDLVTASPDNIRVVADQTEETLNHWIEAVSIGFGIDENVIADFSKPLISLDDQKFFVAYWDDEPISGGLLSLCGSTALIAYVATKPKWRCKGAGKALVEAALLDAYHNGCSNSVLQSSKMGKRIYESLGFQTVVDYHIWRQ